MGDLDRLYSLRFSATERKSKDRIWRVLCEDYFQRFVSADDVVLDLACGFGEFSRYIRAARRIAVDLNAEHASLLPADVEFHPSSAEHLEAIGDETIDVCFTSNFFEHLPDKSAMDRVLVEVRRVLRPGGLLVAMQPNIRYASDAYWDFYDHVLPLSHLSAREGFEKNGFVVEYLVPRFIPWSTKSIFPKHPFLVRLYLRLPWIWPLFGKHFVITGRKPLPESLTP
jgi:SAM-dependent methyltransferase